MEVKKVIVAVNRPGASGAIYKGDLIFEEGKPILVIEWGSDQGRPIPLVKVQLNASRLQRAPASFQADYLYRDPIDDPRKFQ